MFGPKGAVEIGGLGALQNEERRNFCSFRKIVIIIKSVRLRWTRYVARMGKEELV
jgi:hypothetical protein